MRFPLRPSCPRSLRTPAGTALYVVFFALLSSPCLPARAASCIQPQSPRPSPSLNSAPTRPSPREQCFLYAQIVHAMTEQAGQQIASGDTEQAAATLKQVNQYARLIHQNLAHDTKRLKDAEMLMHDTTYPPRRVPPPRLRPRQSHRPGHPQATRPGQRRTPHPGLRPLS